MGEFRINGATNQTALDGVKFVGFLVEFDDFSGANESEIQGIEEQAKIFALIVVKTDLGEVLPVGSGLEMRGKTLNGSSSSLLHFSLVKGFGF